MKIRSFLFLFILFSSINQIAFAQNNLVINGVVRDKKSGERLVGVTVGVKGSIKGAITDFDGTFSLKAVSFPVTIIISYMGFEKLEMVVTNSSKALDIKITESSRNLNEVQITDSRITERQKQAPLTVETMDAMAIKQTPAANFYEGLGHLKGVDLVSASIGFKVINTRGFNSTSPVRSLQLIDGVDNQSPGLNFSLGNFLGASELDVQKVDLVVGASSAYYGPGAFNGVINMETKSPFLYPGLSAQVKVGERNLTETAVRWAAVIKNKKGEEKFAYKINIFYMQASDWQTANTSPTSQSPVNKTNPGGYDAVNTYGDEFVNPRFYQSPNLSYLGYGYTLRDGYKESNLVNYDTKNLKAGTALHYKIDKENELIYSFNFGTGSTIYQGDDRFALKDILFFQNKIELKKQGKYFIRLYSTNEDAGKSYDIYNSGVLLQNAAKSDNDWGNDYSNYWSQNIGDYNSGRISTIRPPIGVVPNNQYVAYVDSFLRASYPDSLNLFHQLARNYANGIGKNGSNISRFEPGTARFDSALNAINSLTNRQGGSRFFDQSALYHVAGEYQFSFLKFDFKTGGNFRLYAPYSKGTIFLDTVDNQRIYNKEFGIYLGVEKKIFDEKLRIGVTNRVDKNQNFNYLWSPAATFVFVQKEHVFRLSVSSALRNPTLSDQYINLNVGRATLLGNLHGFDSLVTVSSLVTALNYGRDKMQFFNIDAVKPEQVQTIEMGYRTTIEKKFFLDISFYHSWYQNFIGYKIGAKVDWSNGNPFPNTTPTVYRVATNSKDEVTTTGFTVGINYFFKKQLGFSFNHSYNELDRHGSTDNLIPAFNTPTNKFNIGINGRDFSIKFFGKEIEHLSYGINYKWTEGFVFEGSPQFTGNVAGYDMIDAQVSKNIPNIHCTVKMGANNLLNNMVYQVYGGPLVGRLAYLSILLELDTRK
ncbi:MAG: carboxypeptidase-like regulatory domain-containing protein [Bacteroidota bacterium]